MRTVDHKILAKLIINQYMQNIPEKYCNAFYIGCIEPDYNPFSYFHGFLKSYTLYGHNFYNVRNFLEKVFKKLNHTKSYKRMFFFRLGLLVHYITDAFTHAHTAQFLGTLREHNDYEQQLHLTFEKIVNTQTLRLSNDLLPCNNINEVSRLHDIYTNEKISVYNDLAFIFSLVSSVMHNFLPPIQLSSNQKLKILITTDWYEPTINGVVISVNNLKNELIKKGHDVRILTLSPNMHSFCKNDVYYISSFSANKIYPESRIRIKAGKEIIKNILEWKPDIVHSQCELSTFRYGMKISKALNIPIVHTYHTVYENYTHYFCPNKHLGKAIVGTLSRKLINKTDFVIAPSEKVRKLLEKYKVRKPISVVPTGIDREKFLKKPSDKWLENKKRELGISDDCITLLFVGRLAKEKNIEEILYFISKLQSFSIRFLIIGDGPEKDSLKKMTKKLGITHKVCFAGMIPSGEISNYYYLGDLFVNGSTSETQGLTYVEAMSSGLPLLCHKDSCLDGVIDSGINGWQYSNEEEFTNSLKLILKNKQTKNKMQSAAFEKSTEFSSEAFAENIENIYYFSLKRNNKRIN